MNRVHSKVERVSSKNAMWAKGHTAALPSYVSTSSYVFAEDPEKFTRTLCLLPEALIDQFVVQLVGREGQAVTPGILRMLEHMKVSVQFEKLLAAWQ